MVYRYGDEIAKYTYGIDLKSKLLRLLQWIRIGRYIRDVSSTLGVRAGDGERERRSFTRRFFLFVKFSVSIAYKVAFYIGITYYLHSIILPE